MTKEEQLKALYARIPEVHCQGKCQACCSNIGMSFFEYSQIGMVAQMSVPLRPMRLLAESGAPIGEAMSMDNSVRVCPWLKDGACSIYAHRPFVCRFWGATMATRCPHGCVPDRWLSEREVYEIAKQIHAL